MYKKLIVLVLIGSSICLATGCESMGQAQTGATNEQVKAEIDKQPPLQQIRNLTYSPLPPAEKEKQIKAIEDKYKVKREDAMKNLPPPTFSNTPPPEVPTGK